jgi:hypothetical protein
MSTTLESLQQRVADAEAAIAEAEPFVPDALRTRYDEALALRDKLTAQAEADLSDLQEREAMQRAEVEEATADLRNLIVAFTKAAIRAREAQAQHRSTCARLRAAGQSGYPNVETLDVRSHRGTEYPLKNDIEHFRNMAKAEW